MIGCHACRLIIVSAAALSLSQPNMVHAQSAPYFEKAACTTGVRWPPGLTPECGFLVVPQMRSEPGARKLRLAVAVYRATERASDPPLLLLHGGPGGSGGVSAQWPFLRGSSPLVRNRDIVVLDLRGTGLSEPQLCPDFYDNTAPVLNIRSATDRERAYNEAVRACATKLRSDGIVPTAYSTAINVADVIDLRHALGYERWDLYGVSYGAKLIQELMAHDAAGIRAVVLASPVAPNGQEAAEEAFTLQRAVERVFAECAAQPACRTAFPTLESDFYAVHDELAKRPLEVHVGDSVTVWLDGQRFLQQVRGQLINAWVRELPLMIRELRAGDRNWAARRLVGSGLMGPWYPIGHLVGCNDYGAEYAAAVAAVKPKLKPAFATIADDIREHCTGWVENPRRVEHARITSDIPTLMLNGEIDPHGTDLQMLPLVASLPHTYSFDVRAHGHEAFPMCAVLTVENFLQDPARHPEFGCAALPATAFLTEKPAAATLVFRIKSAKGTSSPFDGEWEADFPIRGGGIVSELEIAGDKVAGWLQPDAAAYATSVDSGVVRGSVLSFRVKSPDGRRMITFTGTLSGDVITFQRDVVETGPPGRSGAGLFGAAGPKTFSARRKQEK